MKPRYLVLIVFVFLAAAITYWNRSAFGVVDNKHISHVSGSYKSDIQVFLKVKEKDLVYYTLNGQKPSKKNGILYDHSNGISISNATKVDPKLAYIPTSLPNYPKESNSWKSPEKVGSATILKFKIGKSNKVHTYFYLVDENELSLPIVSLNINADDLYDFNKGIYIPGAHLDSTNLGKSGNYFMRGKEWERVANFEYISPDGNNYNQEIGMRLHGMLSPLAPQKTLKFYARKELGAKALKYPFFGDKDNIKYKRLILRSQYSGWGNSIFVNSFVQQAAKGLNFETFETKTVLSYINGEFWGIAQLIEKDDRHYFEQHFGVEKTQFAMSNGNGVSIGEVDGSLNELIDELESMNLENELDYQKIAKEIDIESFIDWMVTETFFRNLDWPQNNYQLWKDLNTGKWRNLLVDMDACMFWNEKNSFMDIATLKADSTILFNDRSTLLFRKLLENRSFRKQFYKRHDEILTTQYSFERLSGILNQFEREYAPYIQANIDRWAHPRSMEDYTIRVNKLRYFIEHRQAISRLALDNYYQQHFPNEKTN